VEYDDYDDDQDYNDKDVKLPGVNINEEGANMGGLG
jgi:hypothetical protein